MNREDQLVAEIQQLRGVIIDAVEQLQHGIDPREVAELLHREWMKSSALDKDLPTR